MLKVGRNCSFVEHADRVAVLVENDLYFSVVEEVLERAERSVLLIGWQFDPRTQLDPINPPHGPDGQIGYQMRRLVRTKPDLKIRILVWNSPLPIAASQGMFPQRAIQWFDTNPVDLRLVKPLSVGASHHQKILVIDDKLAFCSGGDISVDRWDTSLHLDEEEHRVLPSGEERKPRHEVVMMLDGAAARGLAQMARDSWHWVTDKVADMAEVGYDPWPARIAPTLTDARVGVSRTVSGASHTVRTRDCETLFLDMVAGARNLIFLENQYFTSPVIAAAIAVRLGEADGPEVVLVSTGESPSWFDSATMDGARAEVLCVLKAADVYGRMTAWYPKTRGGENIIVHSKVTIIDDRMLRVGSSNLNNRSSGYDTECDVTVERDAPDSDIRGVRQHLIAHFLGVSDEAFAEAETRAGSVRGAIEALNDTGRMAPISSERPGWLGRLTARYQIGDPSDPDNAWRPWKRRALSQRLTDAVRQVAARAPDDYRDPQDS
ncbi:MAG: phospholipase [Caulobacterales bacterium]|nr:phospholipase [Caulobacterales bacterium]